MDRLVVALHRAGIAGGLAAVLFSSSCAGPQPVAVELEQSSVFVSGEGGYHTYRIPALITTPQGTLLAFCEGRRNDGSDTGDIDLLLRRSSDGGRTWGPQQVIWDDAENTCGNPCPVVDQETGTIWLLLTHNPGDEGLREILKPEARGTRTVWVSSSRDEGKTWAEPLEITDFTKDPEWDWYATGPGVGIQLQKAPHRGRLVVPCDHSYRTSDPEEVYGDPTRGTGSHAIYSDDHGQTWQLSSPIRPFADECQVVELADGRLQMNMRSYSGKKRRALSTSADGGVTWSELEYSEELIEPVCQASIIRFTDSP